MPQASQRRGRLGIPKVNQNPRPPRSTYGRNQQRRGNSLIRGLAKHATYHHRPPKVPVSAPQAPSAPSAGSQDVSNNLFGFSSYTPRPGEPDPRDATYWSNLNKLMFNAQGEYRSNLLDQTYSDTDYSQQLEGMQRQRGYDQRSLGEQAIRSNLTRSGWLDRTDAEQTTDYLTSVGNVMTNKQREDAARTAARDAILQGYSVDEAAALAEAADAYAQKQSQNAAEGDPQLRPGDVRAIQKALRNASRRGHKGRNRNKRNNRKR